MAPATSSMARSQLTGLPQIRGVNGGSSGAIVSCRLAPLTQSLPRLAGWSRSPATVVPGAARTPQPTPQYGQVVATCSDLWVITAACPVGDGLGMRHALDVHSRSVSKNGTSHITAGGRPPRPLAPLG